MAPDIRRMLLEDLDNRDFPVHGTRSRGEAWFQDNGTLAVCTYEPGLDTCDNKAAVMTFTESSDGWVASKVYAVSTCARP